jgi:hypothetical protein
VGSLQQLLEPWGSIFVETTERTDRRIPITNWALTSYKGTILFVILFVIPLLPSPVAIQ